MQLRGKVVKRIAELAVLLALSLVLSYAESLFGAIIPLPGVKIGLSNIVLVYILYTGGYFETLGFGALKSVLSLVFLGRLSSLIYSLCGVLLAVTAMYLVKKTNRFSLLGVNLSGAVFHIVGQLAAASFVLGTMSVWMFLPMLCVVSALAGTVTYFILLVVFKLKKVIPK